MSIAEYDKKLNCYDSCIERLTNLNLYEENEAIDRIITELFELREQLIFSQIPF